jgi:hypothetical protein
MGNEFIVEGKKYISASRASKLYGYNSDYIGQLCRKGLVDSRMVGRVWFVEEKSILNHKIVASQVPRGRIPFSKKIDADFGSNFSITSDRSSSSSAHVSGASAVSGVGLSNKIYPNPSLNFKSPSQEVSDFVNIANEKKQNRFFAQKIVAGFVAIFVIVLAVPYFLNNESPFEKIISLKNSEFVAENIFRQTDSDTNVESFSSANVFIAIGDSFADTTGKIFESTIRSMARLSEIYKYTTGKVRLAFSERNTTDDYIEPRDRFGVAVVPSSGDVDVDQQIKDYVTNSFSDEAEIFPDESGNSGVIKPVFKNETDQEYLYVIVPVKEGQN